MLLYHYECEVSNKLQSLTELVVEIKTLRISKQKPKASIETTHYHNNNNLILDTKDKKHTKELIATLLI